MRQARIQNDGDVLDVEVPLGEPGITATVAMMRAVIHSTARSDLVHQWAARIQKAAMTRLRFGGTLDYWQSALVYNFLKRNFKFVADPKEVELLRHPDEALKTINAGGVGIGDCDDRAMVGASLFRAMGMPAVLAIIGTNAAGRFEHVFWGYQLNAKQPISIHNVLLSDPQENVPHGAVHPQARRIKLFTVD